MAQQKDSQGKLVVIRTNRGRGPRIYRQKRGHKYDTQWRMRHMIGGQYFVATLGEDAGEAEKKALAIEARLVMGESPEAVKDSQRMFGGVKPAGDVVTVGDVVEALRGAASSLELRERTLSYYVSCLYMVVRVIRAHRRKQKVRHQKGVRHVAEIDEVAGLPISMLGGDAARVFKEAMLATAKGAEAERRAKRTANSYLRNARAVFSRKAMRYYGHLKLPDLKAFMEEPMFFRVSAKYRMPEEEVTINLVKTALKELRGNERVAFLCAWGAGLRKGEIINARREWFSQSMPWRIWIGPDGDFVPKGGEDGFVEIQEWVKDEILKSAEGVKYLLSGDDTERKEGVFRRLNGWLRSKGLDRPKPLHELRKLFGSYIASTQGLFIAQKFLRHADAQVTSDSYADAVLSERLKALWVKAG